MPFTLAHPAIVLPMRKWLWFPGLVAGSVAPDVSYYLPFFGSADHTHSLAGVVTIDLVWGWMLIALGYLTLAPLLAVAPYEWRAKVRPINIADQLKTWPACCTAICSVILGALSHVVWDSFTQVGGVAVQHWPVLHISVIGPHRLFNVIGYVSSLGGMVLLIVFIARWYRQAPLAYQRTWPTLPKLARWLIALGVTVTALVGASLALADPVSQASGYDWVRQLLIGGVRGMISGISFYVVIYYFWRRLRKSRSAMVP